MEQPTDLELIDLLGGTSAVARLFDVKPPSVSGWRKDGIPADKRIRMAPLLETRTDGRISRMTLFPDTWHTIWPELAEQHPDKVPVEAQPAKVA